MASVNKYLASISNRQRRRIRRVSIWTTIIFFFVAVVDYFIGVPFFPFSDIYEWRPDAKFEDHMPSYFFFGLIATLGTIISFKVLLTVSSREAKTLGEYLDIYNDILHDVKKEEQFYILSPAHNTGQKDSYIDSTVKKKYDLNQKLLQQKAKLGKGEYSLLKYYDEDLKLFAEANEQNHSDRIKRITNFQINKTSYSPMFQFLMGFSKQIEIKSIDDHTNRVQAYVQEAFTNLKSIKDKEMQLRTIENQDYLEAPLVLIISKRMAYFGLYKLTDEQSNATVRGITVHDQDGIETLMLLYKTYTQNSTTQIII